MAGEVDGAVDRDREVGVDLDEALVVSLVPVVGAPGLAGDVLDREALAGRQFDVRPRPVPALAYGGSEDGVHLLLRNREVLPERFVTLEERSCAAAVRQRPVELVADGAEMIFGVHRSDRVVERARLLVEGEALSAEHFDARRKGLELTGQVVAAEAQHLVRRLRSLLKAGDERGGVGGDRSEGALRRLGLLLPGSRTVEGVHVVLVVLADLEDELDVALRGLVHRGESIGGTGRRRRRASRPEERGEEDGRKA